MSRRVSLADVAKKAGVSSNTVSRVVRGDPEVSDATRRRIQALLEQLDYTPNIAARALATSRTGVAHVLLAAPMFHGHAQMFLAIVNALSAEGFHVSVSDAHGAASQSKNTLTPIDVDGVIVLGGQDPAVDIATRLGERMPTVLALTGDHGLDNVSTVSVDNVLGARLATEHLLSTGVTDVVHMAGPSAWFDASVRRRVFVETCEAAGVEPKVVDTGAWDAQASYDIVRTMPVPPAGLFAANDQLALGAMRAMHESGVRLPDESRVIGFDDIAGADSFYPPLSTVAQPFGAMGRQSATQLMSRINGGQAIDTLLEPTLVARASTTP